MQLDRVRYSYITSPVTGTYQPSAASRDRRAPWTIPLDRHQLRRLVADMVD